MAAFFLLMSTYVVPDERNQRAFFSETALFDKKGTVQGEGSPSWYRVSVSISPETVAVSTDSNIRKSRSAYSSGCLLASYYGSRQPSA